MNKLYINQINYLTHLFKRYNLSHIFNNCVYFHIQLPHVQLEQNLNYFDLKQSSYCHLYASQEKSKPSNVCGQWLQEKLSSYKVRIEQYKSMETIEQMNILKIGYILIITIRIYTISTGFYLHHFPLLEVTLKAVGTGTGAGSALTAICCKPSDLNRLNFYQ